MGIGPEPHERARNRSPGLLDGIGASFIALTKFITGKWCQFKHPLKLCAMIPSHPEEVHDFAVQVVVDLGTAALFAEQDASAAPEWFDITSMFWKM
jgi:hypothetical protein